MPRAVVGNLELSGISAGSGHHTCATTPLNVIYCWGHNAYGQLGLNTDTGPELCEQYALPCSTKPREVVGPS